MVQPCHAEGRHCDIVLWVRAASAWGTSQGEAGRARADRCARADRRAEQGQGKGCQGRTCCGVLCRAMLVASFTWPPFATPHNPP